MLSDHPSSERGVKPMTRVLYVEDNRQHRANIAEILTFEGYQVFEAEDGLTGIEVAIRECPDVILMDIEMPGIDGIEATIRLKGLPRFTRTPVVMLTANASSKERERAMQA